jgi:hypothetical protein
VTAAITMPNFERSFNYRYAIADLIASSCLLIQDMWNQYNIHKILVEAAKEGFNTHEENTTVTVNDLREQIILRKERAEKALEDIANKRESQ